MFGSVYVCGVTVDEDSELTAAAIARLAGVGRAAVSNWRRRYPQFPKPVGGSDSSPTFSRAEIEAWLKATGKDDQLATSGRTETGTQRVRDLEAGFVGYSTNTGLRDATAQHPSDRSITELTRGERLARIIASLLPRTTTVSVAGADGSDAPIVLDPACASGTLLTAVSDRFGGGVQLVGQEVREQAASAAALNLRYNAHGAPYEIRIGDSLLDNQLDGYLGTAAAVVCEPPFDVPQWPVSELTTDPRWQFGIPAPRDAELAWVQHCYAHLRPRGVAVVAVSPRTCVQASGQHVRAALVRSGVLREVIALPKGMGSESDTDVYLWVLQRPYGQPVDPPIRFVDLSGLADAADVPHEFAAWRRLRDDGDPAVSRAVSRIELLDGDVNLLPSRHVAAAVLASADDYAGIVDRLQALYANIGQALPRFAAPKSSKPYTSVTFAELERVGALTIRSREATPKAGDLLLRTLGRPPIVATATESNGGGIAYVSEIDGVAQVVEIDPTRLDAHFVAAFLRADANAIPVANTLGALSRDDLRRCRIPRLPLSEQRRFGDAFRRLTEFDEALGALARVTEKVIGQTVHGLINGALDPDSARSRPRPVAARRHHISANASSTARVTRKDEGA